MFLPPLLIWALRRVGYDHRGWILQTAIAVPLLIASRFFPAWKNMNFVFRDPLFHRTWGPAPFHVAVIFAGLVLIIYCPTHLVLARVFREHSPAPETRDFKDYAEGENRDAAGASPPLPE